MNRKQLIVIWGIAALVLLASNTNASFPEIRYYSIQNKSHITDAQLEEIAIRKGIVPKDYDKDYIMKQMEVNNTIPAWVFITREEKLKMIDRLKAKFREDKGVIIKRDSGFYVDAINGLIYDNIADGTLTKDKTSAVGYAFRVLAMMSDDYDNGESRVKTLRNYLGEEEFNSFIKECPDIYKNLIELDKKPGKRIKRKIKKGD